MKMKQRFEQRQDEKEQGSLWELSLFAIFFVVVFSAVARAETPAPQSANAKSSIATTVRKPGGPFKFSGSLLVSTSKGATDSDNDSYSGLYRASIAATHDASKIRTGFRMGYARAYTYQNDDGTDGMMENPLFTVSRAYKSGTDFLSPVFDSIVIGMRGTLPANRDAQKATFQGAVGPSLSVSKSLSILDIGQTLYYNRQFFEYEMKDDGTQNSPDRLVSVTELGLNVTKHIALTAAMTLDFTRNYLGNVKSRELSSIGIDLKPIEKLTISLGYGIDRAALSADGQADAIKIYDDRIAETSLDLFLEI